VFAVYDSTEFELHRAQGHCVAMFLGGDLCTMGMPDVALGGEGFELDPILFRPISEFDELPLRMLSAMHGHGLSRIGDIVCLTEMRVLELLQSSHSDLSLLKDVLAGRGLTLGMQLDGWAR
jgi:DNA-directed RNA polymerase subunit alpha